LRSTEGNTPLISAVQGFKNKGEALACVMGSLADAYLESTPLGSATWLPEKRGPVACLMGLLAKAYPGTMANSCLLCRGLRVC
jgi:hypothetical protein